MGPGYLELRAGPSTPRLPIVDDRGGWWRFLRLLGMTYHQELRWFPLGCGWNCDLCILDRHIRGHEGGSILTLLKDSKHAIF
jgi:hypothetical protein